MFSSLYLPPAPPPPRPVLTLCCASPCMCGPRSCDGWCCGSCGKLRGVALYSGCCAGTIAYIAFALAFFLAPTGAGFLIALASNPRADVVAAFNAASTAWPNASRAFANLSLVAVTGSGGTLVLAAVTTPDVFPDTADGVIQPTVGMRYFAAQAADGGPIAGADFSSGATTSGSLTAEAAVSPWSASLFTSTQTCQSDGPNSNHMSCTSKYRCLTAVCFVLDANLSLTGGCALDRTSNSLAVGSQDTCDGKGFVSFAGTGVDVRFAADPYVVAMRLTNGSLNFGLSQAAKLVVGGTLLGIAVLVFGIGCPFLAAQPPAPADLATTVAAYHACRGKAFASGGAGAAPAAFVVTEEANRLGNTQQRPICT